MNQEYAEMDLLPNDPRTTSRRSIGASAGIEAGAGAKAGASAGAESGTEARQAPNTGSSGADASFDPLRLNDALWRLGSRFAADPSPLASAWLDLAQSWGELCTYGAARMLGVQMEPVARPDGNDHRFRDSAWNDVPWLDILKQAYLVNSRACTSLPAGVAGLDESSRSRLEFAARQVTDALAPTNFFPTNPEAIRAAVESGGTSAVNGMRQLLRNLDPETGRLDVRMCPPEAFTVGESIAATPGKVVFQNDLIQLIQYAPATPTVRRRPMLLIPPWMNKYYVMDLRPGNSMVEWLVGRGHTVFIISWVNPDSSLAGKGFDNYMLEGPLAALEAIERATGEREVNAVGYCLGGILLSALSAWLQAKGDTRLASTTYLATMVDFSDVGAVGVFIDEEGLPALESAISARGYLSGQQVADTWRAVRANDLIWSFYVNSYLLGKEPPALDLLFWNCDPTNMPAAMHTFLMRNMYVENRLREPGGLTLGGEASTSPASLPPPTCCRRSRTTSRRGRQPTRPRSSSPVRWSSCSGRRGTSPASSTPPRSTSTGTGRARRPPPHPRRGSPQRKSTRARGGRTGTDGSSGSAAARCRPGYRAAAGSPRSRTPPAATSCGRCRGIDAPDPAPGGSSLPEP